jgi:UDP-GlcNAc:undecaprenyl-phosphate/decaprenyl-phosphate GlcNAc-1-phosphate transferase
MDVIVPAFMISFLIAFSLIPLIIDYSKKRNWLDQPGGRKIHTDSTPALGGIAIFCGFMISLILWSSLQQLSELRFIYIGIVLTFFLGVRDDILPIAPIYKVLWQVAAALTVIYFADVRITSMHGILGLGEIPLYISYGLTIFTVVVITNAFNLIDGINGLAGTMSVVSLSAFAAWFYFTGNIPFIILVASLAGAILAFLKFNYTPAQIFMGDTGALTIGFVMSVLAIKFIEGNAALPHDHIAKITCNVSGGIAIVLYPLFDTLRIFTIRIARGRSPFSPDKNHVHHLLVRITGGSHLKATFVICMSNALLILVLVLFFKNSSEAVALPVVLIACMLMAGLLQLTVRRFFANAKKNGLTIE